MMTNKKQIRHLGRMNFSRYARNVEPVTATESIISEITKRFSSAVDCAAELGVVLRIFAHNSETMIAFRNKSTQELGGIAILPLNSAGYIALGEGTFDTASPRIEHICRRSEKPTCVYIWAVNIAHATSGGIALVMQLLNERTFADLDLFSKPTNSKAHSLLVSLGFEERAIIAGHFRSELLVYERNSEINESAPARTNKPNYATFDANGNDPKRIGIKVVHGIEELLQALAIRAATYLPEQDLPYDEDVDGNDFCAAHLVGYIGKEPAATLRVRFFAGFVKLERLAVLPRFRSTSIGTRIIRAGIDFSRDKGYWRFYGQSEQEIIPMWKRAGFTPRSNSGIPYLTNRTYCEGDMIARKSPHAITPNSGANVLIRREGEWHLPGAFEVVERIR